MGDDFAFYNLGFCDTLPTLLPLDRNTPMYLLPTLWVGEMNNRAIIFDHVYLKAKISQMKLQGIKLW